MPQCVSGKTSFKVFSEVDHFKIIVMGPGLDEGRGAKPVFLTNVLKITHGIEKNNSHRHERIFILFLQFDQHR